MNETNILTNYLKHGFVTIWVTLGINREKDVCLYMVSMVMSRVTEIVSSFLTFSIYEQYEMSYDEIAAKSWGIHPRTKFITPSYHISDLM